MPFTILAIMEFKWLENGNLSGNPKWLFDYGISLQIIVFSMIEGEVTKMKKC